MKGLFFSLVAAFILYAIVGTSHNVDEIRDIAPADIDKKGWNILRYEGFQYGSFYKHGGKVWYHVANKNNPNIQYRVNITLWNGELQYWYGKPETLNRVSVDYK